MSTRPTVASNQSNTALLDTLTVPTAEEFSGEYLGSEQIEDLAERIIEQYPQFHFIRDSGIRVTYLWKAKGGKSHGRNRRGQCQKVSGLLSHFCDADFIIWLAADHTRDNPNFNFKRLVFHELKHIDLDEKGQQTTQGHEFEGFSDEVEEFGIWEEGLKPIATAFQQHLF